MPAELGDDIDVDLASIDAVIKGAAEGRATVYRLGRGGCVEIVDGKSTISQLEKRPSVAGWRRRARVIEYCPYR